MKIQTKKIDLQSEKQLEFMDVTSLIEEAVESSGVNSGVVVVFSPHTTGAIVINHNEPMLLQDMTRILYKMVPIDERYSHDMFELTKRNKSDGRSNGHSHCKNMLLGSSETVPIEKGELVLGNKQSIFFVELDGARKRDFVIQIMGE
jgi:secondary thiamine-phosphate synthase enzyme